CRLENSGLHNGSGLNGWSDYARGSLPGHDSISDSSCLSCQSAYVETTLPHAFTAGTLHDLAASAWNMDTGASSHLNNSITSLSEVFNSCIYPYDLETTLPHAFTAGTLHDLAASAWNMDTGASSHLNNSITSLSEVFNSCIYPYDLVGDSHSIPVTNTGHSILQTPFRSLHLNSVLVTPHIVKNLIYARQFVHDNNCTVEFDAFGFCVKDFMTRRVLLRCDNTGDLYPVTTPSLIPHAFLRKFVVEILEKAHMATCNPSRTPVHTESKLGNNGDLVSDLTLYRSLAVQHQCTKHIEINIHFVRDLVVAGQVRVLHVPSRYQCADIFTKGLPFALFEEFHTSLSVQCPSAPTARELKSDVFSFGVLVLEIVSGKKNREFSHEDHSNNLLGHAWRLYKEDKSVELMSAFLCASCIVSEVLRSIHVGLLCVQRHPKDRPTMLSVLLMLVSDGALPTAKQPAFFTEESNRELDSVCHLDE
nr:G-type lectin S-receptor-like serine/threonine-protein kinase At4g27290 [Tanacetum cinerariifolium]